MTGRLCDAAAHLVSRFARTGNVILVAFLALYVIRRLANCRFLGRWGRPKAARDLAFRSGGRCARRTEALCASQLRPFIRRPCPESENRRTYQRTNDFRDFVVSEFTYLCAQTPSAPLGTSTPRRLVQRLKSSANILVTNRSVGSSSTATHDTYLPESPLAGSRSRQVYPICDCRRFLFNRMIKCLPPCVDLGFAGTIAT